MEKKIQEKISEMSQYGFFYPQYWRDVRDVQLFHVTMHKLKEDHNTKVLRQMMQSMFE